MKFYLNVLPAIWMVFSCSSQSNKPSQLNDYDIDFGKEFIFVDPEGRVNYEICDANGTLDGKHCKISYKHPSIAQDRYISEISSALNIDKNSLKETARVSGEFANSLEKVVATISASIKHYKNRLENAQDPREKAELTRRVVFYEDNLKLFESSVAPLLASLFTDRILPLERNLASDLDKISILIAPFGNSSIGEKNESAEPLHLSPETGEVYAVYPDVCWYDVMGINREVPCTSIGIYAIGISSGNRISHISYGKPVRSKKPSCKKVYGQIFSVQSDEATELLVRTQSLDIKSLKSLNSIEDIYKLDSLRLIEPLSFPVEKHYKGGGLLDLSDTYKEQWHWISSREGEFGLYREGSTFGWRTTISGSRFNRDPNWVPASVNPSMHRRLESNYICSAPVRIAEPDQDIDGDGVENASDRCNISYTTAEEHTLVTDIASARYGCYKGQKTDEEYPWLRTGKSDIGSTPWPRSVVD